LEKDSEIESENVMTLRKFSTRIWTLKLVWLNMHQVSKLFLI